jgi:hypothetical protein
VTRLSRVSFDLVGGLISTSSEISFQGLKRLSVRSLGCVKLTLKSRHKLVDTLLLFRQPSLESIGGSAERLPPLCIRRLELSGHFNLLLLQIAKRLSQ